MSKGELRLAAEPWLHPPALADEPAPRIPVAPCQLANSVYVDFDPQRALTMPTPTITNVSAVMDLLKALQNADEITLTINSGHTPPHSSNSL